MAWNESFQGRFALGSGSRGFSSRRQKGPESNVIFPLLPKRLNVSRQTKALLGPFCCSTASSPPTNTNFSGLTDGTEAGTGGRGRSAPVSHGSVVEALPGKLAIRILGGETWKQIPRGTHQLPGVADVVGIPADVPQPVGVPGQGRVDGYADDLTSQRKAGRTTAVETHRYQQTRITRRGKSTFQSPIQQDKFYQTWKKMI